MNGILTVVIIEAEEDGHLSVYNGLGREVRSACAREWHIGLVPQSTEEAKVISDWVKNAKTNARQASKHNPEGSY